MIYKVLLFKNIKANSRMEPFIIRRKDPAGI